MSDETPALPVRPGPSTGDVAVVIPFFNGSDTLERALRSVFAQTVPAAEVLVVDDGSRPEENQALNALAELYPFRVLSQANGGQGSARNLGVANTVSPYICFLDQDDFYLPRHIEALGAAIPADDLRFGFVYADLDEADAAGRMVQHGLIAREPGRHPKRSVMDMLRHDMFVVPSAALISREAFEAVQGFDTQFRGYEDDDLFLRIFRAGYSNHFLAQSVTVWCIHGASTSYGMTMIRSRDRFFHKMVRDFPDEPLRVRFYLRDCLVPRFGKLFVEQCMMQVIRGDEAVRIEMSGMLARYIDVLVANPYISRMYIARLRVFHWLMRSSMRDVLKLASRLVRMPGLRFLLRLYR